MYYGDTIIRDISKTLAINLSKTRELKLLTYIEGKDLPIDTIQELIIQEYNSVGPQGISVTARVTEQDYVLYQQLMAELRKRASRSAKKELFKTGLRLALMNDIEVVPDIGRELKIVVNLDIELLHLIKRVIAKYSTGIIEISGPDALRYAIEALSQNGEV